MLDAFSLPIVQRGVLEVLVLAVAAGVIGTWVVLRGLAFFSHAVGTAAFPGLVLADGLGFSAHLGAGATAGLVAAGVGLLARRDREHYDSHTALVLVGALVAGVVLASDVFASGSNVDSLLFGSLLAISPADVAWAAGAAVAVLVGTALLGRRWTATGFDPGSARALGTRPGWTDAVLLGLVALVAVTALSAVGALLASALIVVPAVTARLVVHRLRPWRLASVALAAVEGVAGLWLAFELNAPPGATIAVLGGCVFALVAIARWASPHLRRRRLAPAVVAAGLLALAAAGCGGSGSGGDSGSDSAEPLPVVATTTQLGDVARAIGGKHVAVTQILKPNTDPHDYEPRPEDVTATAKAKVVLESGDKLDGWMADVVKQSGGKPSVAVLSETNPDRRPGETSGAEASEYDPHWWHDPRNVEAAVPAIQTAFTDADPGRKAAFAANARAYVARLKALDAGIRKCMAAVPAADRKLVTDHDAFDYFAHRYGVSVVGAVIPSQTTQAQASAKDVAKLSDVIRREHVRAIFPESSINPKLAEAIAAQTGATSNDTLYGDTLGPKGSDGATYLTMEAHNADAMVHGFTGGRSGCTIQGL